MVSERKSLTIFLLKFIEMLSSYKKCQKIGVGRVLGRIRNKSFIAQTIPEKVFGTKWSNPVKLDGKGKVWSMVFFFA